MRRAAARGLALSGICEDAKVVLTSLLSRLPPSCSTKASMISSCGHAKMCCRNSVKSVVSSMTTSCTGEREDVRASVQFVEQGWTCLACQSKSVRQQPILVLLQIIV